MSLETGINLPGGDYRGFDLPQPWPENCRNACNADSQCRAWTYVKPGVQSQKAKCWLKASIPQAVRDPNCVSGVKAGGAGQAVTPAHSTPGPRQYFVYYKIDEWTCCKPSQDMGEYPFQRAGEVPHPILVGEIRQEDARIRKLSGPFASDADAKRWLCGNHQVRGMQSQISNMARVGGVLVSNLPCPATVR